MRPLALLLAFGGGLFLDIMKHKMYPEVVSYVVGLCENNAGLHYLAYRYLAFCQFDLHWEGDPNDDWDRVVRFHKMIDDLHQNPF